MREEKEVEEVRKSLCNKNHFLSYAVGRGRERGEREYMKEVHTTDVYVA